MTDTQLSRFTWIPEFATELGYIARIAMSKEELEHKIYAQKVTPEELAGELHERIAAIAGTHLGQRPNGDSSFEVKLPFSLRDRHVYMTLGKQTCKIPGGISNSPSQR